MWDFYIYIYIYMGTIKVNIIIANWLISLMNAVKLPSKIKVLKKIHLH